MFAPLSLLFLLAPLPVLPSAEAAHQPQRNRRLVPPLSTHQKHRVIAETQPNNRCVHIRLHFIQEDRPTLYRLYRLGVFMMAALGARGRRVGKAKGAAAGLVGGGTWTCITCISEQLGGGARGDGDGRGDRMESGLSVLVQARGWAKVRHPPCLLQEASSQSITQLSLRDHATQ